MSDLWVYARRINELAKPGSPALSRYAQIPMRIAAIHNRENVHQLNGGIPHGENDC